MPLLHERTCLVTAIIAVPKLKLGESDVCFFLTVCIVHYSTMKDSQYEYNFWVTTD